MRPRAQARGQPHALAMTKQAGTTSLFIFLAVVLIATGLFALASGTITVADSLFAQNSATDEGGGAWLDGQSVVITDTDFVSPAFEPSNCPENPGRKDSSSILSQKSSPLTRWGGASSMASAKGAPSKVEE